MTDAEEAIIDIEEAIEEFGSDIVIRKVTQDQSQYDPLVPGSGIVTTETPTKALIGVQASEELAVTMPNELINNYSFYLKLQTDIPLVKNDDIIFDNKSYNIVYISKKILQNKVLFLEILVK